MQILLAEDNTRLAELTRRSLVEDGYMVDVAENGQVALDKYDINQYDIIILDVLMPEMDGFTVGREIRARDTTIPILFLTALGEIDDKVKGFQTGADDYVVKPFSFAELNLRVQALLRRGKRADPLVISSGKLALDTIKKQATYDTTPLNLTAKELGLLEYLLIHKGRVVPKTELLEHVWDMNYTGLSNVVETYVRYIRQKIRETGEHSEVISTVRGLGYVIGD